MKLVSECIVEMDVRRLMLIETVMDALNVNLMEKRMFDSERRKMENTLGDVIRKFIFSPFYFVY